MRHFKIGALITLCALFITACSCTKQFTVTFDSNGGTKVESQTVVKGDKVSRPSNPTKEGYSFEAWMLDGEVYDFDSEVNKDITLKAKWSKVKEPAKEEEKVCTLTCAAGYAVNENCECYKLSVTSINVESASLNVDLGANAQIKASVYPENVLNKNLLYSSSNENVAKVSATGVITGVGVGTATITITSADSGVVKKITVEILDVYEYEVKPMTDNSTYSKMVVLYKNGALLSSEELANINAIYTSDVTYIGRYESTYEAIMIDASQENLLGAIKVNGRTYKITKHAAA